MERSEINYQNCVKILEEELLPAMGCTEPIALAYAGAVARKTLNKLPDRVEIEASGNIIKNVNGWQTVVCRSHLHRRLHQILKP